MRREPRFLYLLFNKGFNCTHSSECFDHRCSCLCLTNCADACVCMCNSDSQSLYSPISATSRLIAEIDREILRHHGGAQGGVAAKPYFHWMSDYFPEGRCCIHLVLPFSLWISTVTCTHEQKCRLFDKDSNPIHDTWEGFFGNHFKISFI